MSQVPRFSLLLMDYPATNMGHGMKHRHSLVGIPSSIVVSHCHSMFSLLSDHFWPPSSALRNSKRFYMKYDFPLLFEISLNLIMRASFFVHSLLQSLPVIFFALDVFFVTFHGGLDTDEG